jgi:hypothetical protein
MKRLLAVAVMGICLAVAGSLAVAADPPANNPAKLAQADIVALSQNLNAPDVADRARKIVQTHDSCDISTIFTMKTRGGHGIGASAEELKHRDSIEHWVIHLSRSKTMTEALLEKYQADYVRTAKVLQAMAELAPFRAPPQVEKHPTQSKEWKKVTTEFKADTAAFRAAIEEKDPKKLRFAAQKLHHSCCNCHSLAF